MQIKRIDRDNTNFYFVLACTHFDPLEQQNRKARILHLAQTNIVLNHEAAMPANM